MDFVTYTTYANAFAADASTLAFLKSRDGARGNAWSNIYTDDLETEFGISYAVDVNGFFGTTNPKAKKVKKDAFHKKDPPVLP